MEKEDYGTASPWFLETRDAGRDGGLIRDRTDNFRLRRVSLGFISRAADLFAILSQIEISSEASPVENEREREREREIEEKVSAMPNTKKLPSSQGVNERLTAAAGPGAHRDDVAYDRRSLKELVDLVIDKLAEMKKHQAEVDAEIKELVEAVDVPNTKKLDLVIDKRAELEKHQAEVAAEIKELVEAVNANITKRIKEYQALIHALETARY